MAPSADESPMPIQVPQPLTLADNKAVSEPGNVAQSMLEESAGVSSVQEEVREAEEDI